MYARVARYEGADPDGMRQTARRIDADSASGPPEGLPAVGLLMLIDADQRRCLAVTLYDSEDDMRKGDATLNAMNPPGDGLGRRASVGFYEVAVDRRLTPARA